MQSYITENYILQGKSLSESEEAVHDVATPLKDITEKGQPSTGQDELNLYLGDMFDMYKDHESDDV